MLDPGGDGGEVALGAGDEAVEPAHPLGPFAASSIASSTHSIEGVLIVSPRKIPSISLPFAVSRKSLGSGQGGV